MSLYSSACPLRALDNVQFDRALSGQAINQNIFMTFYSALS